MKLFLKADRCFTEKCAIEKRNYAPGQHGKGGRIKKQAQGYGLQLREKQKVKRLYGMLEGQFALTFERASQEKGVSGELLLSKLERRLSNVVYRLGFGSSQAQGRQLVRHGHVQVNDHKIDIPSYQVKVGDVITLASRATQERPGAGLGRGGQGPRRAALARARRREPERQGAGAARPGRRELPDPGAADRRAVLEVRK